MPLKSKSFPMIETLESRQLLSDVFGSIDPGVLDPIPDPIVGDPISAPFRTQRTVTASGTLLGGVWRALGPFAVSGNGTITAAMTGTGDADLYVRRGSWPSPNNFDCRPYASNSNETCTLNGGGTYYVAVRGYAAISNFNITITYDPA